MEQEKSSSKPTVVLSTMANEDLFSNIRIIFLIAMGLCAIAAAITFFGTNSFGRDAILNSNWILIICGYICVSVILCFLWKKGWIITIAHLVFTLGLGFFFSVDLVYTALLTIRGVWGSTDKYAGFTAWFAAIDAMIGGIIIWIILIVLCVIAVVSSKPVRQETQAKYNSIFPDQR